MFFIDTVFQGLIDVVENMMFQECQSRENQKYKAIFDSLQEGILIIDEPQRSNSGSTPSVALCNEIGEIILQKNLNFSEPLDQLDAW